MLTHEDKEFSEQEAACVSSVNGLVIFFRESLFLSTLRR